MVRRDRYPLAVALVSLLAGLATFVIAAWVFPYHSTNHDEAVYLMQAALLLDGQLAIQAGSIADAVRPWFFVADGGRLYPKYSPVPAALYAVSMGLVGEPRVTLAVVAAANVALVGALGTLAVDRRVGLVASMAFAASPMALLTSSVFLPYAPTTLFTLAFAVAYLYGIREHSAIAAALAGVAIGIAVFSRPYTALLFAAPFVCHAGWRVLSGFRRHDLGPARRHALTAVGGLGGVAVTLAYNVATTGDPLLFPYAAFAPLDGPGFGHREILGHAIEYTPALAVRVNAHLLWELGTRWVVAGPLGTLAAVAGLAVATRRWWQGRPVTDRGADRSSEIRAGGLLVAVVASVVVGNLAFWGTYNVLGAIGDPTDGLIALFGPFYQFDLLAPVAVFVGIASVAVWRAGRSLRARLADRIGSQSARAALGVALALAVLIAGVSAASAVATPVERNLAHTDGYAEAYAPIEESDFEHALVFLPTPYGDWLHHPFQPLRNDPGLDGPVVYALSGGPAEQFDVIDAYPDRQLYRYTYQGTWTSGPDRDVTPRLEDLAIRRAETLSVETRVGVPDRVAAAQVRLETREGSITHSIADPHGSLTVPWSLSPDGARLTGLPDERVGLADSDHVVLTITLIQPTGGTLTYRQDLDVRIANGRVAALWPPERSVCTLVTDCGREGTYLPDRPETHRDGVSFETRVD
ncbi:hypothetical protein HARCEL1_01470 [Halococcoides cellulosivorans]|uniref:DUF7846 domain-containing protein n=1 Tax=Halococcoides cellulosivorans TaxID=1679096 RepID=A0A2R4X478_9EURY|nr:hypothetical protein HARCEL1_01470 [Halococcoides cellulosivorans]